MSYMGKGVTKNATLCLQHLTDEMAARALDQVSLGQVNVELKTCDSSPSHSVWVDLQSWKK